MGYIVVMSTISFFGLIVIAWMLWDIKHTNATD